MKKTKYLLIILDLIWSLAALIYDWPIIITLPWYGWPFIVICPLYPLLLALAWGLWPTKRLPAVYFITFTALASTVWGLLALVFYPLTMLATGWSWNAAGQIVWIWAYALQGWWLYRQLPRSPRARWLAGALMIIILTIQYSTQTLGYLDVVALSAPAWLGVYLFGLVSVVVLVGPYQQRRRRFDVRSQL